jgi:hypothetical protein
MTYVDEVETESSKLKISLKEVTAENVRLQAVVDAARAFIVEQNDQPQNIFHGSKRVRVRVSALVKALAAIGETKPGAAP